jgi:hypothetical protein
MFLSSSSMSVLATEEDAKHCYNFANKEKERKFYSIALPFEGGIQLHYENFRIGRVSSGFVVLVIFCMLSFLRGLFISFTQYESIWLVRIVLIMRNVVCWAGLYLSYKIFYARVKPDSASREEFGNYVSTVTNLSNFVIVVFALGNGLIYAWKSSLGSCVDVNDNRTHLKNSDLLHFDCNTGYEVGSTSTSSLIILLLGNIFLVATLRCHSYWAAAASYVVTAISVLAAAAVSRSPLISTPAVFVALYSICMYNSMESNSLTMFKALLDLESTNRVKTAELKHFIGNVAHDLKVRMGVRRLLFDFLLM